MVDFEKNNQADVLLPEAITAATSLADVTIDVLKGHIQARRELEMTKRQIEIYKIDQLTGFLCRDAFLEEVGNGLNELRRHWPNRRTDPDSALFVMLDIVGLKAINESGGHPEGDRAIKATANFISHVARLEDGDIAGRLGGDELAFYMPYSHDHIKHQAMVDKISDRVMRTRKITEAWNIHAPAIRYRYATVSPSHLPSVKSLLVEADPKRPGFEPIYSYPTPKD